MTDVLPGSARARRSLRDLVLPAVLLVELLTGVALGAVRPWQHREMVPGSSVPAPGPGASGTTPRTPRTPPAQSPSTPAPQVTHTPVNPFSPG